MAARRLTVKQMLVMRANLEEVQRDLRVFLDPNDTECPVSPAARREAGAFIDSWALGPIETSLATLNRMLEQ